MDRIFSLQLLIALLVLPGISRAQDLNGFDLSRASIPFLEIMRGGPPKDGIPAIDNPKFAPVGKPSILEDNDKVFGISFGKERRAYPLRILVFHEIVNDIVGGHPVAITYCPLCGTAMAFDRKFGEDILSFGVSGLLYQSDVLMYDRQSESLWSQLGMQCVSGEMVGKKLKWLSGEMMTWKAWREKYPGSSVLTTETGFFRDNRIVPYQGYEQRSETIFPFPENRRELKNKEWVAGVMVNSKAFAFNLKKLAEEPGHKVILKHDDTLLAAAVNPVTREVQIRDENGKSLPVVQVFWFAWQAFYPETILWNGQKK